MRRSRRRRRDGFGPRGLRARTHSCIIGQTLGYWVFRVVSTLPAARCCGSTASLAQHEPTNTSSSGCCFNDLACRLSRMAARVAAGVSQCLQVPVRLLSRLAICLWAAMVAAVTRDAVWPAQRCLQLDADVESSSIQVVTNVPAAVTVWSILSLPSGTQLVARGWRARHCQPPPSFLELTGA